MRMGIRDFYSCIPANIYRSTTLKESDRIAVDLYHMAHCHFSVQAKKYVESADFRHLDDKRFPELSVIMQNTVTSLIGAFRRFPMPQNHINICVDYSPTNPLTVQFTTPPAQIVPLFEDDMPNPGKNRPYEDPLTWEDLVDDNFVVTNQHVNLFMKCFPFRGLIRKNVLETFIQRISAGSFQIYSTHQFFQNTDGEALCAYLNRIGWVDYGLTADSDFFLYGGRHIMRNSENWKKSLHIDDIMKHLELPDFDSFEYMCLMLGTDFNNRTPLFGPKKSHKEAIERKFNHPMPPDIANIFRRIAGRNTIKFSS